jgi:hypothetical protein
MAESPWAHIISKKRLKPLQINLESVSKSKIFYILIQLFSSKSNEEPQSLQDTPNSFEKIFALSQTRHFLEIFA